MTLVRPSAPAPAGNHVPLRPPRLPRQASPRRRQWATAIAVGLVVLTAALVVQRIGTADPLSFHGGPEVWRSRPGDERGIARVDNALGTDVTVGFVQGGPFVVRMGLVNDGRHGVRIQGISRESAYSYRLERVETSAERSEGFVPFEPFTLAAGDTRWFQLHFRFAECRLEASPGSWASRTTLPVGSRILGIRHREAVPFEKFALSVPGGECDHPAL